MWVLDARYKAEKVWYSIIWEKAKEDPNVIDYNINEEITKDTSAVFNANNDTTTGMANVIPWVNAPKLIAKTSIIWIDFNAWYQWSVYIRFKNSTSATVPANDEITVPITTITRQDAPTWPYEFKWVEWKWIVLPTQWTYKLECMYWFTGDSGWSGTYKYRFDTMVGWKVVHQSPLFTASEYNETFTIDWKKGQWLMRTGTYINSSSSSHSFSPWIWVTITKL